MSLYDTLKINVTKLPLPAAEIERLEAVNADFQTKSLEQMYSVYSITDDGYLERGGWRWRDDIGKPQPTIRLADAHGLIFFYTSVDGEWFEFKARFREGKLTDLIRMEKTTAYRDRTCVWEEEIPLEEPSVSQTLPTPPKPVALPQPPLSPQP